MDKPPTRSGPHAPRLPQALRGLGNDDFDTDEDIGPRFLRLVLALTTVELVSLGATNEKVFAFTPVQLVRAETTLQHISATMPIQPVPVLTAPKDVVPLATVERVVTLVAMQRVVAAVTVEISDPRHRDSLQCSRLYSFVVYPGAVRAATLLGGVLVAAVLAASASGQAQRSEMGERAQAIRVVEVASGFDMPVHIAAPSNEKKRLYVVEQRGYIRVIQKGKRRAAPFLNISRLVGCCGEQGLLSVAFHPSYKKNRKFYVNYTNRAGNTEIVVYRANKRRTRAVPSSRRLLLRVNQPFPNHNGGQIAFGPNGRLYIGMGDGGLSGDPNNVSQRLSSRLGKMLSINVKNRRAKPTIDAIGLRNPWRFSFDRKTDDLYIGDVGENSFEEISYRKAGSTGLANYGWDAFEGKANFEPGNLNSAVTLIAPVATYGRDGGCSVTGGHVYRGKKVKGAVGRYFYGDYCTGNIWSLRVNSNGKAVGKRRHVFRVSNPSSFGENAAGELFIAAHQSGAIYRLAS